MGKKIAIAISAVIVVLIGVGVWWLFDTGRLVYQSEPVESAGSVEAVCGKDIVDRYSLAATYGLREGSEEPDVDMGALNSLSSEIKNNDGYEDDPSCQAILFQVAVLNDDYKAANTAYEAQVRLHEEGRFSDNNILGDATLPQHENYLRSLTGAPVETEPEPEGMFDE